MAADMVGVRAVARVAGVVGHRIVGGREHGASGSACAHAAVLAGVGVAQVYLAEAAGPAISAGVGSKVCALAFPVIAHFIA